MLKSIYTIKHKIQLATVGPSREPATTYNLSFRTRATAVSGSQC